MKMIKFIAPRSLVVNSRISPCDCDERTVCSYCVQANLLALEKKFQAEGSVLKSIINNAKKNGIRQTARKIGVEEKSLRRWFNSGNVPSEVLQKLANCGQA